MTDLLRTFAHPKAPQSRPALAVGTMNFGKRMSEAESIRLVHHAIDRGITLFDTANAYVDGLAEKVLGKALANRRDKALVATKVGFMRIDGKPEGLKKERIKASLDESLKRLGMDCVDVFYLHVPDHNTPLEESLEGIEAVLASGKAKSWAISNYASWQILEMIQIAKERGLPRPIMSQVLYNMLIRQLDIEYFRFAKKYEIHSTIYNPLAGGLLAGKHPHTREPPKGSRFDKNALYQRRYWTNRFFELSDAYKAIAEKYGLSLVELSYAFLAHRAGVDSILLGPGSIEHLDSAIDAIEKTLPEEAANEIEALAKDFLGTDASYAR